MSFVPTDKKWSRRGLVPGRGWPFAMLYEERHADSSVDRARFFCAAV
jgi:hypothetical protein